jgi:CrcB protein
MVRHENRSLSRRLLAVFCGGFCGTLVRYLLSIAISGWLGKGWPFDILLINLSGALLLALITTLADATFFIGPTRRLLLNTGFMGAYTTFSSLALGDVLLFGQGQILPALLYLLLSLAGGLCAVLLGNGLGQLLLRCFRRADRAGLDASEHLDIQDDLLLVEQRDEIEAD